MSVGDDPPHRTRSPAQHETGYGTSMAKNGLVEGHLRTLTASVETFQGVVERTFLQVFVTLVLLEEWNAAKGAQHAL